MQKFVFFILDSEGKNNFCSEPQLLVEILTCKASINLQIKQWAQGRSEYILSKNEIEEYTNYYKCPEWVLISVESQKEKILKEWIADKKYLQHSFYKDALSFYLGELLQNYFKKDKL